MKMIAVSDAHGYVDRVREILVKEGSAEVVVFCGDIAPYRRHFETLSLLRKLMLITSSFSVGYTIAVPGNVDYVEHYEQVVEPRFVHLHMRCRRVENVLFAGVGGSTITPFNTMLEYSEEEMHNILQSLYTSCIQNRTALENELYVLVTHTPPYSTTCDRAFNGEHIGSKSIRRFIESSKPMLALCGHVHESRCIDRINNTIVVNPGPLARGFYSIIYIDKGRVEANLYKLY